MDDLAGLDRLDGWLNLQQGKFRLLLLWLDAYPLGFALGYALWACWAFRGNADRAILGAAAAAPLGAILLLFVLSGLHALRIRQMRSEPGKVWARLSWRRFAARFLAASYVLLAFTDFADNQYGRPHPALLTAHWLQDVILAGCVALGFAEDRYSKQVGKRRAHPQAPAPAGTH